MKNKFILVLSTINTLKGAKKIAISLVKEKLAACVNISSAVQSIYSWKEKLCQEKEYLLFIKTQKKLYPRLEKRLKELHPYKVPEIIALPIEKGSSEYLEWVNKNLF